MRGQQLGFRKYWNKQTVTTLEPPKTVQPLQSGIPAPKLQNSLLTVICPNLCVGHRPMHDTALDDEINDESVIFKT